jgi:hypothetical protein
VREVEASTQDSFEGSYTPTQRRDHMGQLNAHHGGVGEEVANAVFDWTTFNVHLIGMERSTARRMAIGSLMT